MNDWESDISFTYVIDDSPIFMKEGLELKVPNYLPLYFLYRSDELKTLAFNLFSGNVVEIAFSRAVDIASLSREIDTKELVNENLFDTSGFINKSQLNGSRVGVMKHISKK
jgi:hypothetical protein